MMHLRICCIFINILIGLLKFRLEKNSINEKVLLYKQKHFSNLASSKCEARLESVFSKCESCYAVWRSKIANLLSRIRKQNFTICSFLR